MTLKNLQLTRIVVKTITAKQVRQLISLLVTYTLVRDNRRNELHNLLVQFRKVTHRTWGWGRDSQGSPGQQNVLFVSSSNLIAAHYRCSPLPPRYEFWYYAHPFSRYTRPRTAPRPDNPCHCCRVPTDKTASRTKDSAVDSTQHITHTTPTTFPSFWDITLRHWVIISRCFEGLEVWISTISMVPVTNSREVKLLRPNKVYNRTSKKGDRFSKDHHHHHQ